MSRVPRPKRLVCTLGERFNQCTRVLNKEMGSSLCVAPYFSREEHGKMFCVGLKQFEKLSKQMNVSSCFEDGDFCSDDQNVSMFCTGFFSQFQNKSLLFAVLQIASRNAPPGIFLGRRNLEVVEGERVRQEKEEG